MRLFPSMPFLEPERKPLPIEERLYASFKGEDTLGYEQCKTYQLYLWRQLFKGRECLWVRRSDNTGHCPYSSYEKFQENWEVK